MPEVRIMRSPTPSIDVVELKDVTRPQDGACKLCKALLLKVGMECTGFPVGKANPQVIINGGVSREKMSLIERNAACFK